MIRSGGFVFRGFDAEGALKDLAEKAGLNSGGFQESVEGIIGAGSATAAGSVMEDLTKDFDKTAEKAAEAHAKTLVAEAESTMKPYLIAGGVLLGIIAAILIGKTLAK